MESLETAIYCDNKTEGTWFARLHPILKDVPLVVLRNRDKNVDLRVAALLTYDRPDIILMWDGTPILVLEKTREVPTGHNVGQRMARLVRAIELGVPTIKFFPFEAMKHGKYANRCLMNPRILDAMRQISTIHQVPLLAVNWPCDAYFELVDDGSEDIRLKDLLESYFTSGFDPNCVEFETQSKFMSAEHYERTSSNSKYMQPPPSISVMPTTDFLKQHYDVITAGAEGALAARDNTVVYRIGIKPASCRREDPYTGMQFIYDYALCRNGIAPSDKKWNLILEFPELTEHLFVQNNPNDSSRKSSNWYLTASGLLFSDGFIPLHL